MSNPSAQRIRSWRRHRIAMGFAVQPQFCCGCLCLAPQDAMRLRRVFALVRAITRGPAPTIPILDRLIGRR